jgi:hypothetical protein
VKTETHEIADGIYRFSTIVPEVAAPAGNGLAAHCEARAGKSLDAR